MKKKTNDVERLITEIISHHINRLQPRIRKKVKFIIDDKLVLDRENKLVNASCLPGIKPKFITINLLSLVKSFQGIISDNVIELLRHELTHLLLNIRDEKETSKKEKEIDIFL